MRQPTLRTCPYCGSKRRRLLWVRTTRRSWNRRYMEQVAKVQCRNGGCGLWRVVELA